MEIFKDIPGYEGLYQAGHLGNIKSLRFHKEIILKPGLNAKGYLQLVLSKNGKQKNFKVHRLILLTFDGPSDLDCNHINGIKTDNRHINIEYCTKSENMLHAFRVLGHKSYFHTNNPIKGQFGKKHPGSKQVDQYTKEGEFIRTRGCMSDVKRELGIHNGHISSCCTGKRKTAGNFTWQHNNN